MIRESVRYDAMLDRATASQERLFTADLSGMIH